MAGVAAQPLAFLPHVRFDVERAQRLIVQDDRRRTRAATGRRESVPVPLAGRGGSDTGMRRVALVVGEHRAVRCVDGGRDDFVLRAQRRQDLARRLLVLEGEGRHAVGADDLGLRHEVVTHARAERGQVVGEEPDRGQRAAPASW